MTIDPTATDTQPQATGPTPGARRFRFTARWALLVTLAAALAVDQISKELALHALLRGPATFAGVRLHLVANRGVLLGFPAPTGLIVVATIGVVILALRSARGSRWMVALAYGLLAGGALGNLFDRLQDRHFFPSAAVVDWISVGRVTFNLADVFLITGVAILLFLPNKDEQPATGVPGP